MNKDREIWLLCSMDLDILKHYCLNKAMEIGQNRLSWGLQFLDTKFFVLFLIMHPKNKLLL